LNPARYDPALDWTVWCTRRLDANLCISADKVSVMVVTGPPPEFIDRIRCAAGNGLPQDIAVLLHKSIVQLAVMRRSIELINLQIEDSTEAALESEYLLARLRRDGL
jgi:hypothetical protein